jgi:hypothetical protein
MEFVAGNDARIKIQNLHKVMNHPVCWTIHIEILGLLKTKSYPCDNFLPNAATIRFLFRELINI